ncbi:MAG: hypothetical protein VXZ05_09750 [Pseudomonadota bacterium]|nr:hypothetical protein [Pseudomonadota bacterium]
MNSSAMIALAILTGLVSVVLLVVKKWLEERRLTMLRESLAHLDTMSRVCQTGETLRPWISEASINVLARLIDYHASCIPPRASHCRQGSQRAKQTAEAWHNAPPKTDAPPLPSHLAEAKELRKVLVDFLDLIKEAHRDHLLPTEPAREHIHEAKVLNTRLCVNTVVERATLAISQCAPRQALQLLERANKLLSELDELPPELIRQRQSIAEQIQALQEELASTQHKTPSRLSEGTDDLIEAEMAWKKKTFD